jgi:hypothetical protein
MLSAFLHEHVQIGKAASPPAQQQSFGACKHGVRRSTRNTKQLEDTRSVPQLASWAWFKERLEQAPAGLGSGIVRSDGAGEPLPAPLASLAK